MVYKGLKRKGSRKSKLMMKTLRKISAISLVGTLASGVLAGALTFDAWKKNLPTEAPEYKIVVGSSGKTIDVLGAVEIAAALQYAYKEKVTATAGEVVAESTELTYADYAELKDTNDEWIAKGTYATPVTLTVTYDKDKPATSFLLDEGGNLEVKVKTFDYKEDFGYYVEFDSIKVTLPFKELTVTSYDTAQTVAGMSVDRRVTVDLYGKKYYVYWNSANPNTIVLVAATGDVTLAEGGEVDLGEYGYSGYKIKVSRVLETGDTSEPYEVTLQLIKDDKVVDEITQRVSTSGVDITLKDDEANKEIKLYNVKAAYHRFEEKYYVSFRFEAGTVKEGEDIDDYWTLDSSSAVNPSSDKADVTLVFTFKGWDKYEDTFGSGNKVLKLGDTLPGVLGGFEIAFPGLEEPEYGFLKVYVHGTDKYIAFEAKEGDKLKVGGKELSYLKVGYPETKTVTVKLWDANSTTGEIDLKANITGMPAGWKAEIYVNDVLAKTFTSDAIEVIIKENLSSASVDVKVYDALGNPFAEKTDVAVADNTAENNPVDASVSDSAVKIEQAKDTDGDLLTEDDWSVINKYIKADTHVQVAKDFTEDKVTYEAWIDPANDKIIVQDSKDGSSDDVVELAVDFTGGNAVTDVIKQDAFEGVIEETVKYTDAPDYVTIKLPIDVIRAKLYAGSKIVGKKEEITLKPGDVVYVNNKKYKIKEIKLGVEEIEVPKPLPFVGVLDTEVTDSMTKLIVVGGPAVNKVAADFLGVPFPTYGAVLKEKGILNESEALIKIVEKNGKVAVLVFGWEGEDTLAAAKALARYIKEGAEEEKFTNRTEVKVVRSETAAYGYEVLAE